MAKDVIPAHMRPALTTWLERGQPHPSQMGSFLRALLENDLMGAAIYADDANRAELAAIALYLYNEVPSLAHGSPERLKTWHEMGGLVGIASDLVARKAVTP